MERVMRQLSVGTRLAVTSLLLAAGGVWAQATAPAPVLKSNQVT